MPLDEHKKQKSANAFFLQMENQLFVQDRTVWFTHDRKKSIGKQKAFYIAVFTNTILI